MKKEELTKQSDKLQFSEEASGNAALEATPRITETGDCLPSIVKPTIRTSIFTNRFPHPYVNAHNTELQIPLSPDPVPQISRNDLEADAKFRLLSDFAVPGAT